MGGRFAEKIAQRWTEKAEPGNEQTRIKREEEPPVYTVRPVKLTLENGVEFQDV